jgi:3-oxoacyl-[acyl-carrier-protein] synthase-1
MRAALEEAAVLPSAITYLNLHGTATPHNDAMEGLAVERVLGGSVPASSTKPLVGHTLGAAGAIEAAFCWLVLARAEDGRLSLPPHRFSGDVDPDLPSLALVDDAHRTVHATEPVLMSNSFGFGGNNTALVLGGRAP